MMNAKGSRVPRLTAADSAQIAANRPRLLLLAEGVKARQKPSGMHPKKVDPTHTNIEHLVFSPARSPCPLDNDGDEYLPTLSDDWSAFSTADAEEDLVSMTNSIHDGDSVSCDFRNDNNSKCLPSSQVYRASPTRRSSCDVPHVVERREKYPQLRTKSLPINTSQPVDSRGRKAAKLADSGKRNSNMSTTSSHRAVTARKLSDIPSPPNGIPKLKSARGSGDERAHRNTALTKTSHGSTNKYITIKGPSNQERHPRKSPCVVTRGSHPKPSGIPRRCSASSHSEAISSLERMVENCKRDSDSDLLCTVASEESASPVAFVTENPLLDITHPLVLESQVLEADYGENEKALCVDAAHDEEVDSGPVPETANPAASPFGLFLRFSSLRSMRRRAPIDAAIHRFRKSFSLRFPNKGSQEPQSQFFMEMASAPCNERKCASIGHEEETHSNPMTLSTLFSELHVKPDVRVAKVTPTRSASILLAEQPCCSTLRRSVSQPAKLHDPIGLPLSDSPSGDKCSESDVSTFSVAKDARCLGKITYAEALWDHVTMDVDELSFTAGQLIEVLDLTDQEWWWGRIDDLCGWFPAAFIRLRVNQTSVSMECLSEVCPSPVVVDPAPPWQPLRSSVVMEILSTERDFVRHLQDVIEGYLVQVRKRPDMFSAASVKTIFGNVESLYEFHLQLLSQLESCIVWSTPYETCFGHCFLHNCPSFHLYSEYCNNLPHAMNELQRLFANPKYLHFFEACRLLRDMIDISLDGFLLTPVQKICKYPLQLSELLKCTPSDHTDYVDVSDALATMRTVAKTINECKRRMECLEKLAAWQLAVDGWQGADLLERSSLLLFSGDVVKVSSRWSRELTLFLFDHQLIICKKDLLKRSGYTYRGRINLDQCKIMDLPDGRDLQTAVNLRCAWRMYCCERSKWFIFSAKSPQQKEQWMQAFRDERQQVGEDEQQGFLVNEEFRQTIRTTILKNVKLSGKESLTQSEPGLPARTSRSRSLPHRNNEALCKKKNNNWFQFGSSGRNNKR